MEALFQEVELCQGISGPFRKTSRKNEDANVCKPITSLVRGKEGKAYNSKYNSSAYVYMCYILKITPA